MHTVVLQVYDISVGIKFRSLCFLKSHMSLSVIPFSLHLSKETCHVQAVYNEKSKRNRPEQTRAHQFKWQSKQDGG